MNRQDTRNIKTTEDQQSGVIEKAAVVVSLILFVISFPLSLFICLIVLKEYERAVIFRLGRLKKGGARGPGLCFVLPCIDNWTKVDLRTASFDVPPQEILTKDSVTVQLDAVVYYRIQDPLKAVIQVDRVRNATRLLAQTTLRNIAGTKMLIDLLADKDSLSQAIGKILDEATDPWGIKVERVEIKEIRLPEQLQRAMAAEQEAARNAKAKVAAAEGEFLAAAALKEAADVMTESPLTLQLRYLQTLNVISAKNNHTYVFPYPINLVRRLIQLVKGEESNQTSAKANPTGPCSCGDDTFRECICEK